VLLDHLRLERLEFLIGSRLRHRITFPVSGLRPRTVDFPRPSAVAARPPAFRRHGAVWPKVRRCGEPSYLGKAPPHTARFKRLFGVCTSTNPAGYSATFGQHSGPCEGTLGRSPIARPSPVMG
jgi:hypothetical protein